MNDEIGPGTGNANAQHTFLRRWAIEVGREEPMASEWYCTRDGKQRLGPFSAEQLRQLAASGMLLPGDLVWKQGLPRWVPASQVKGLFPATTISPPGMPAANEPPRPAPAGAGNPFEFESTASQGTTQPSEPTETDDDEAEVEVGWPYAVGANLSNPLDRFAALLAILWGLAALLCLMLYGMTDEGAFLLLTLVVFIGGGIGLGLFVRHVAATQCPKCLRIWAKQDLGSTLLSRQGGYDTVTRYQKDASGKIISTWEEQVHVTRERHLDAYQCRHCRHRWRGVSARQYEG